MIAVVGIAVAAVLGFVIAHGSGGHAPSNALDQHASAGLVRVSYPSDWRTQTPPVTSPLGLTRQVALAPRSPAGAELVIGTTSTVDLPALSQRLLVAFPGAPAAQIVTLGGVRFYRYLNVSPPGKSASESVYALATTGGTVVAECVMPAADSSFTSSCERTLATLRLTSGSLLPLGPSVSYAAALDRVIGTLNAVRLSAGLKLRSAHDAQAQAKAADELAAAHSQAATAVLHLSAGSAGAANGALATALRMTSDAYGALGRAAANNDAAAYSAASASVTRATSGLNSAFSRLSQLGYRVG